MSGKPRNPDIYDQQSLAFSTVSQPFCSFSVLAEIQKKFFLIFGKVDNPMHVKILLPHFQNVDARLFGVVIHPDGLPFLHFCKCYYQTGQFILQSH